MKATYPSPERVAERREGYASQLQRLQAQQDVATWLASLKAGAKIERFESRLAERNERNR